MMKKQVYNIVHEAYAKHKRKFLVGKERTVFHPVTNFIPNQFNEAAFP